MAKSKARKRLDKIEIYCDGSYNKEKNIGAWAGIITKNRALIRPYVQAFLIGKELNMEYDEYTRYLEVQIEGIKEAGGSGYTMWNNSNRYYMVAD